MFDTQVERLGNVFDHLVEVEFLLLEHHALLVEHRHLQHLLDQEAQALRLVGDDTAEVARHLLGLGHALVVHHLGGQRDRRDGGLQLVGHVVDEVVLDL